MFRKYLKVVSMTYQEGAQYRLNYLLSFLCVIFPLLAVVFLWRIIFRDIQMIGGFTESMMITYYVLVALLTDFVSPGIWFHITEDIREGTLSKHLLRPISHRWYHFSEKIGVNLGYLLIALIVIAGFILLFAVDFYFPANLLYILLFLVSVGLSMVLATGLTYLFCLSAFWLEEVTGLYYVLDYLVLILSGALIPLALLPEFVYQIASFLPFKYLLYFPIEIFLERITLSEIGHGLLMQILWIGAIYLLTTWVWRRGCQRYTARGG
ncbi:ABC-2 family transporter protein [Candidatus Acetothermia bacterium]|nr:ABC-2 family transporter protein [Candidatus Acetothermia bacterium]